MTTNTKGLTVNPAREARAAARAERLSRLRATALSTMVHAHGPKGLPEDEPLCIAGSEAQEDGALADMALPPVEVPVSKSRGRVAPIAKDTPAAPAHVLPTAKAVVESKFLDAQKPATAGDDALLPQRPVDDKVKLSPASPSTLKPAPQPTKPEAAAPIANTPSSVAITPAGSGVPPYRLDALLAASPPPPMALPAFSLAGFPKTERPARSGPYPVHELYRDLRQNVLGTLPSGQAAALAWISPTGTEDAAPHLIELALALAESSSGEVLLVDANLQSAALSRRLGLAEKPGLSEVLAKKLHAQAAGLETAMARIRVLPRGVVSAAQNSRRGDEAEWKTLLGSLKSKYQYVLIDAPGIEQPHCLPLVKASDAAFLVVGLDYTPRETIYEALEVLELQKARVAGCVLTDAPQ
jgi:Mrp family chromosome partitioning ATPase